MRKKIINAIMLIGAAGILGSGAAFTSSYLVSNDQAVNTLDATDVTVSIDEEFESPKDPEPGDVITKKPRAVNTSSIDIYVRMRAEMTNCDLLEPLIINDGWTLKPDGFYYYKEVLKPGESTENLFNSVTIKSSVQKDDIKDLDVLVYAEAVQAGNLTAEEAWAAMD